MPVEKNSWLMYVEYNPTIDPFCAGGLTFNLMAWIFQNMGPHLGSRYMYMLYMKPVVTGLDLSMRKVFKTTCREFVRWICEDWIFCSYYWNMFFCSMENCSCSIVSIENLLFHGVSFGGTMASAICFKEKTMILQMHNTHIIVVMTWYHTSKKTKSFSLVMNTIKC